MSPRSCTRKKSKAEKALFISARARSLSLKHVTVGQVDAAHLHEEEVNGKFTGFSYTHDTFGWRSSRMFYLREKKLPFFFLSGKKQELRRAERNHATVQVFGWEHTEQVSFHITSRELFKKNPSRVLSVCVRARVWVCLGQEGGWRIGDLSNNCYCFLPINQ